MTDHRKLKAWLLSRSKVDVRDRLELPVSRMYYDRDGQPITWSEWSVLFDSEDYKRIARTELERGFVSTIWMGINHGFNGVRILIFETMAFPGEDCQRYSTETAARAGHEEMVAA